VYITDAPPTWRAVTIRQLMAHTSGIKDDYWQLNRGSPLINYDEKDITATR
jgi:CubicO group peptidase (beta-lactamase class C family)